MDISYSVLSWLLTTKLHNIHEEKGNCTYIKTHGHFSDNACRVIPSTEILVGVSSTKSLVLLITSLVTKYSALSVPIIKPNFSYAFH